MEFGFLILSGMEIAEIILFSINTLYLLSNSKLSSVL